VRNQLHALVQGPLVVAAVRTRMEQLITTLSEQIAAVEAESEPALRQDQAWAAAAATSIRPASRLKRRCTTFSTARHPPRSSLLCRRLTITSPSSSTRTASR